MLMFPIFLDIMHFAEGLLVVADNSSLREHEECDFAPSQILLLSTNQKLFTQNDNKLAKHLHPNPTTQSLLPGIKQKNLHINIS